MSIEEDLRISNVDGESAPHEFLSDIREASYDETKPAEVERVELAQAQSSEQAPKTDRVENVAPAPQSGNPNQVVPDQNNVAHLPAGVSLDDIRIEGSNLVLVQADGTEIVIVNGALNVPTFMLGDVELLRDTVIAALNDSNINVAAGPDGGDTATPAAPSSGAEFQDTIQQDGDAPPELAQLLADTQQLDAASDNGPELFDDVPVISETQLLTLTETANGEGGFEEQTVTGQFGFDGGEDVGVITSIGFVGTTNIDEEGGTDGTPNGLTSGGKPVTVTVSADGLTITGTVEGSATPIFVLKVTNIEAGAFTFTQSGPLDHPDLGQTGAADTLRLRFSYTVTDKDGDSATGTASIDINDDGPGIDLGEGTDNSAVNEAGLLGGESAAITGSISLGVDWGADHGVQRDLTFDAQSAPEGLTSHGAAIHYEISANGHTLTAYTGPESGEGRIDVFVVKLDPTSAHGSYTFQLLTSIDHPQGETQSQDTQIGLSFDVTASDADGDTTASSFMVTINDDVPNGNDAVNEAVINDDLQEFFPGNAGGEGDAGTVTTVSGGAGSLFTPGADGFKSVVIGEQMSFSAIFKGVDGFAHTESVQWGEPSIKGTDTTFTATGGTSGQTVATLVVHADGSYEFIASAPLVHSESGTVEDELSLTVNYTVTDGDNDSAKGSLTVTINDDTPTASIVTAETVLDDEAQTTFAGNNGGSGDVADAKSVTGAAGALFTAGADGVASVAFTTPQGIKAIYNVDGHGVQEALTYTTTTGENGETILTATGADSHAVVFTLTVGADGSYKFDLSAPLVHPTVGASEENLPLTIGFTTTDGDGDTASGSLTINVNDDVPVANIVTAETVLDDEAQTTFAGNNGGSGDVADAKSVTGAAGALFTAGADGVASVAFTTPQGIKAIYNVDGHGVQEALTYTTTAGENGETILTATGADSHAVVFTLTVGADGSYKFDLSAPLVHPTVGASEENLPLTIGFTTTDGDGDTASGSLTINVNDDVPVLSETVVGVTADEGDISNLLLSQGNSPNDGTADGSSSEPSLFGLGDAATVSGSVASTVAFGADGEARVGSFSFTADATQTLSALQLSSKGGELSYTMIGNMVVGYVNTGSAGYNPFTDRTVLSLTLNSDGSFKFQQYDQLDHAPGAGNDLKSAATTISGIDFGSVIQATDRDGDSVTLGGKLVVTITDDLPTVSISLTGRTDTHDETGGLNAGSNDTGALSAFAGLESGESLHALGYARNGNAIVHYGSSAGADEPKSVSLTLDVTNANSDLKTAAGEAITLTEENGLVVGRDAHGDAVFAISIDSSGRVSIAQYQAIQHPNSGDVNDLVNLAGKISAVVTATDFDGDVATRSIDIGGKIQFRDDAPVLSGPAVSVTADEGDIFNVLSQGNSPNDGTADGSSSAFNLLPLGFSATVTGSVASTVAFGADGAAQGGGFSFTANVAQTLSALQLSSKGGELSYAVTGNMVIGYVNIGSAGYNPFIDRPVLSLTLNSDGSFKFQQYDQLDHASGAGSDLKSGATTISGIDFGSVIQATDRDGDSVTLGGKLVVTITDDAPEVGSNANVQLDDDALAGGNAGGNGDVSPNLANVSGILAHSYGTDGAGTVLLTGAGLASSAASEGAFSQTVSADGLTIVIHQVQHGVSVDVLTVTLTNASSGAYTLTQNHAIQHAAGNGENNQGFTIDYQVTDGDGDAATGSLTVSVNDDTPVSTGTIINVSTDEVSSITGSLETLVSPGADGIGRYGVELTNLSSILTSLSSNGVALTYTVVDNSLIAKAGSALIFTFAVNAETGAYTFTQNGALDNIDRLLINGNVITPATALDAPGSHFALADVGGNNLAFEGRMGDGDAIIRVTNDSNTNQTWTLDNHGVGTDYVLNIPAHTTWYVNVGNVANNTQFDLDGSGAPNGVTVVNNGHGGNIVAIDGDTSLALDLSSAVTVTDGDGDSVALSGQLIVTISDDVPVATGTAQTLTLSETGLPVVDFASLNINIGADSKNTHVEIGTDSNGLPIINAGLTSDGVALQYIVRETNGVDQEIVAFKAGDTPDNPVFIVSVLHPGSFATTLFQNLDHAAGSDSLSLNLVARVFDGDGDYVDQPFAINVADSVPTLVANTTVSGNVVEGGPTLETHSFASGTVNLAIPDVSTISSTITAPAGGTIHDVNVSINLTHTFMADLEITLIAPDGTRVRLVDDNGGSGDPNGTIKFDDEAASSFTSAIQPYVGTWRPAIDQLSLLDGKSMAGTWTLEIRDDLGADVGTLRNWTLEIESGHDVSSDTIDLSSLVSVGADGAAVFALKTIATAENLGTVTAGGQQVKVVSDGTTLTGYAEGTPGTPLFTLTVSPNGTATFVLHGEFDHAAGSDKLALDLGAYVQALDSDHDAVTLGVGQFVVNVADSLPTATDVAAAMSENESKSITLTEGTHFSFSADENGAALSIGTPSYTGVPAGLTLGMPSITLGADGRTISIVPGTAFDGLAAGEIAVLHIPFTVTDGDHDSVTKDIAVTITGANDAADIGAPTVSAVTEDTGVVGGLLKATGTLSVSDADHDQSSFQTAVTSGAGNLGTLVLGANGNYTYSVSNEAVQYLQDGEQRTETFTIKSADGTAEDVSFTINGANDAAVIGTPTVFAVTEDVGVNGGFLEATGTIAVNDSDHDQSLFQTAVTSAAGNLGTLVLDVSGNYTYSVSNAAVQYLQGGEQRTETFTIKSADGTVKDVSFIINGMNDAPVITSGATGSEAENSPATNVVYQIVASDADAGANLTYSLTGSDADKFNVSATGAVTFKTSPNFEAPTDAGGNNVYDIIVHANDGAADTTKAVAITVTNVAEGSPLSVNEAASLTGRYAFADDNGSPNSVNYNVASLFSGGAGTVSHSFEKVYSTGSDDWLSHSGSTVTGNPSTVDFWDWDGDAGLYIYRVTAADSQLSQQSTYVAFSAIEEWGTTYSITNNGNGNENGLSWINTFNVDGDLIFINSNLNGALNAGGGHDVVIGSGNAETVNGGSGNDALYGMGGGDTLNGGYSTDFIDGGDGNDSLYGENGNDVLLGGAGNDILVGGDGDDILVGGSGLNTMTGGGGGDTFVIDAAALKEVSLVDVITDFKNSQGDTLDVSNLLNSLLGHEANEAEALANVKGTVAGGNTTISVNDNGTWHDVAVFQNYASTVKIIYDDDHHSSTTPVA
ncbi:T1SS-143 domain-containing protein/predicted secreted protein (type I secretion substrate) [Rhizobium azibense]|nr:T1SS-143 domain-containing protein/predicted secreted protein (type I secretion substrate) [Rhizobium azibense]